MAEWFEVYNAKGVLRRARRRSNRLVWIYALVSGALVAAAPVAALLLPTGGLFVAIGCAAALVVHGIWLIARLRRIHGKIWRLDLSVHRALGFDTGRRSWALTWPDVHRVDVTRRGLLLIGRTHGNWVRLRIPASFPHYVALAHRVVEYAEAHDRPIWVDGQPWQTIGLADIVPRAAESGPQAA